jgi:hypothetical protein
VELVKILYAFGDLLYMACVHASRWFLSQTKKPIRILHQRCLVSVLRLQTSGTIFNKHLVYVGEIDISKNIQLRPETNERLATKARACSFEVFKEFLYLRTLITPITDVSQGTVKQLQSKYLPLQQNSASTRPSSARPAEW